MLRDDRARQDHAQPRAVFARREERRADAPQGLRRHATAAVADDDRRLLARGLHLDLDPPARRRGLDRVRHEVEERLLEAARIGLDDRVSLGVEPHPGVIRPAREHLQGVRHDGTELHARRRHRLQRAREGEVVLEDLLHPRDFPLHDLQTFVRGRLGLAAEAELDERLHAGERILELVGHLRADLLERLGAHERVRRHLLASADELVSLLADDRVDGRRERADAEDAHRDEERLRGSRDLRPDQGARQQRERADAEPGRGEEEPGLAPIADDRGGGRVGGDRRDEERAAEAPRQRRAQDGRGEEAQLPEDDPERHLLRIGVDAPFGIVSPVARSATEDVGGGLHCDRDGGEGRDAPGGVVGGAERSGDRQVVAEREPVRAAPPARRGHGERRRLVLGGLAMA